MRQDFHVVWESGSPGPHCCQGKHIHHCRGACLTRCGFYRCQGIVQRGPLIGPIWSLLGPEARQVRKARGLKLLSHVLQSLDLHQSLRAQEKHESGCRTTLPFAR